MSLGGEGAEEAAAAHTRLVATNGGRVRTTGVNIRVTPMMMGAGKL